MVDIDTRLKTLVAEIKSGRKVTFFLGAGISTNAGIPDFRSPETGVYANLSKFNLPYPEAVFDIDYFEKHPKPFYTLAHELYPGNFAPTKFHHMIKLFENHNLLHRVYTQNIDTLERIAGINHDLIVEAHGSFAQNHCIKCSAEMSSEVLKQHMAKKFNSDGIPKCHECNGLVKPDITFFGEGLPGRFFDLWDEDCENVNIAIVAGTSLAVYPFASLPAEVEPTALRVLINQEAVGDFTTDMRKTDILLLDDCDVIAEKLVQQLGWEEELLELIKQHEESTKAKEESVDGVISENEKSDTKTEVVDGKTSSKTDDSKADSETPDKHKQEDEQSSDKSTDEVLKKIDKAISDLKI